jgi:extradiol dioxygenase family protein
MAALGFVVAGGDLGAQFADFFEQLDFFGQDVVVFEQPQGDSLGGGELKIERQVNGPPASGQVVKFAAGHRLADSVFDQSFQHPSFDYG